MRNRVGKQIAASMKVELPNQSTPWKVLKNSRQKIGGCFQSRIDIDMAELDERVDEL